jgi:UPF0755 protein
MRLSWGIGWYLRLLLVAGIAAGVLIAGAFAWYAASPHTPPSLPLQFNLKAGTTLRGAAHEMGRAGALRRPEAFVLMGRLLRTASRIKAGNYEITEPVTPYRLLQKIVDGDVTQSSIRFVEGWTFRQMREVLNKHPDLAHATRDLADGEILQRLGIQESSPEGWFFPDTYHFASGSSDLRVLRRAHHLMRSHLDTRWPGRAPDLPLATPYEALILASIVEKETGKEDDRPLIAAVLLNRLRKGMLLQADPTVIYGLGAGFDGNLRKRDLLADSPYNTYTRAGLPPTPIAMPGLAALTATLNPPASDALYFVSRGDGTSHFSRTLGEHERAVTKYQRSEKR